MTRTQPRQSGLAGAAWGALVLLAGMHFLVDIIAGTTNPIWRTLERSLQRPEGGLLWVYVCWSFATSMGQLFFGWLADGRPSRWLIWVGPLIGVVCISCLGLVSNAEALAALFILGGLGIAAFHPEAAAVAGSLMPSQRSRFMAIFALAGYLGQSVGPVYCGLIERQMGLSGLVWNLSWGLPMLACLYLGLRSASLLPGNPTNELNDNLNQHGYDKTPPQKPNKDATAERVPWLPLLLLLLVGALRILPALGVPLALVYLLSENNASTDIIGATQSAFMAGIGVGAMACAAGLKASWERPALWIFPLIAAPVLATLRVVDGWSLVALVGLCGLLLGITMPVFISYGQRLLPRSQRMASSVTMGVSWGVSSGIVALAMWTLTRLDQLPSIFWLFAAASALSSLLCLLLPQWPNESTTQPRPDGA